MQWFMASQIPLGTESLSIAKIGSFICVYHAYQADWTLFAGEKLLLQREPENAMDKCDKGW